MNKNTKLQDKFIIADSKDNVATARLEINAGLVLYRESGDIITVQEKIPFGHKIALEPIAKGQPVLKYGHRIGVAMKDIIPGELVHVHNLEGERGRSS
jgi:hypothetical protein